MVICKILSLGFPISNGNIPFQIGMKGKQNPCTSADTSEGSEVLLFVRYSRVFSVLTAFLFPFASTGLCFCMGNIGFIE